MTQENKKKAKKKFTRKKNDEENTFRILRLVFLFIIIKYIYDKEKKEYEKKINK